jgi:hypothetical protein
VYDFFSIEEGGKGVFSGPVCSMARSSLEWSPYSPVLVGGKGVWAIGGVPGGVRGFEDWEHFYEVLAPGVVVFGEHWDPDYGGVWGMVVPRVEVSRTVEEGTRVIELQGLDSGFLEGSAHVYELTDSGCEYYTDGDVKGGKIVLKKPLEEGSTNSSWISGSRILRRSGAVR